MLSTHHRSLSAIAAFALAGVLIIALTEPAPGAAKVAVFKSYEPSGATGALPEEYNYNCYEEHVMGDPCLRSRRTTHWDVRGADKLIRFTPVVSRLTVDMCCPVKPPLGVCYPGYSSCEKPYEMVYTGPGIRNTLCCTPGSCFWFEMSLLGCDAPKGYMAVDQTASCASKGWKLVCPAGKDLSNHALSTEPLDVIKYRYA